MPDNKAMENCIKEVCGSIVFCEPGLPEENSNWGEYIKDAQAHIIDVFSLKVATGIPSLEKESLSLQTKSFVVEGITLSIFNAAYVISKAKNPKRWVVLHHDKKAWGMFFGGGGIQKCRELLGMGTVDEKDLEILKPAKIDEILQAFQQSEIQLSTREKTKRNLPREILDKELQAQPPDKSPKQQAFYKSRGKWFSSEEDANEWERREEAARSKIYSLLITQIENISDDSILKSDIHNEIKEKIMSINDNEYSLLYLESYLYSLSKLANLLMEWRENTLMWESEIKSIRLIDKELIDDNSDSSKMIEIDGNEYLRSEAIPDKDGRDDLSWLRENKATLD